MRNSRIVRSLAVLCCITAVLAGCSGGKKKAKTTTTTFAPATTVGSTAPASTTSTTVRCPAGPLNAGPSTGPAPSADNVLLTKVETANAPCLDTVAFSFRNGVPGYTVSYGTPPFVQDGSGNNVAVAGNAFIVVKMKPAYGYDFEKGSPSYTGSKRLGPVHGSFVTEVVETGDFEGTVTWVIGLNAKRPFMVTATRTATLELSVAIS